MAYLTVDLVFWCEKVSFQAMKIHEENLSAYFLVKEVTCPVSL